MGKKIGPADIEALRELAVTETEKRVINGMEGHYNDLLQTMRNLEEDVLQLRFALEKKAVERGLKEKPKEDESVEDVTVVTPDIARVKIRKDGVEEDSF